MKNKMVALLPIKANSERVKNKNFRKFAGKPLFKWMLDSLVISDKFEKVIINTDAKELLIDNGLNESEKIVIRTRKKELCGDDVSMNLILEDDINCIDADVFFMTHATNPLISPSTISDAVQCYLDNLDKHDTLFSVNKFLSRFYDEDNTPLNHDPKKLIRTQDLTPWYEENSCIYIFTKASFKNSNSRIGKTPIKWETPPLESIDIDTETDWYLAESIALRKS
ncbi:acylneuraminate cytidylyltransferase family protein [Aliikangiella maris]|uniref:Acylneuraminate cytidylyltransferase family protein n=2 Tax=Aliikangiella maris TaxID=3162458 RepID=A0ABV3MMK6_9GAMM